MIHVHIEHYSHTKMFLTNDQGARIIKSSLKIGDIDTLRLLFETGCRITDDYAEQVMQCIFAIIASDNARNDSTHKPHFDIEYGMLYCLVYFNKHTRYESCHTTGIKLLELFLEFYPDIEYGVVGNKELCEQTCVGWTWLSYCSFMDEDNMWLSYISKWYGNTHIGLIAAKCAFPWDAVRIMANRKYNRCMRLMMKHGEELEPSEVVDYDQHTEQTVCLEPSCGNDSIPEYTSCGTHKGQYEDVLVIHGKQCRNIAELIIQFA